MMRRKRNEIVHLEINGKSVNGVEALKQEIHKYFASRFSQRVYPDIDFEMGNHAKVSEVQARALEILPSREEVKQAVWDCGIDKAPGFDGFNFKFIREMWEDIKEDIYDFVISFLEHGDVARAINVT